MTEKKKYGIFAAIIMVWGIMISFMIPMWQTPDENTHIMVIGQSLGNERIVSYLFNDVNLDAWRVAFHSEEKIDTEMWIDSMTKSPSYSFSDVAPSGLDFVIVRRLPSTIGLLLGLVLRLPTFWVLQLGELFALLFYTIISVFALKLMPIKKELFAMLMLLPMAIQEAASFSIDAVLLPLIYLFIAYMFYMRYEAEKVTIRDVILTLILWGLITYIKVPYVFLILLVFMIPLSKIEIHFFFGKNKGEALSVRQLRIVETVLIVAGGTVATIGVYIFRHNVFVQVVHGMVTEWKQAIHLIYTTFITFGHEYVVECIGNFGWLDTPSANWFVRIVGLVILFVAMSTGKSGAAGYREKAAYKITARDRIVCLVTFVLLILFTMMAMVNHTITVFLYGQEMMDAGYNIHEALYQIPYIGGLQGRYFIPYATLFFVSLPEIKESPKKVKYCVMGATIALAIIYTFVLLKLRYIG